MTTMRERLIAAVKSLLPTPFPHAYSEWADGFNTAVEDTPSPDDIVDAILSEPRTLDAGMMAAGKKADWVGEIEGRAGQSIRPADLGGYRPDHPDFAQKGIWAAMIDHVREGK